MEDVKKYKVGYVVLHYQTINDTCNCIYSIISIMDNDDCIIIVDNGSPNKSGEKLKKIYQNDSRVEIIVSTENLGFSRGNNLGYNRAKYKHKCDFIVLLNNDTLIRQHDFRENLISGFCKHRYDIVGPKVLRENGEINLSTPIHPIHTSVRRAKLGQILNYVRWMLAYINLDVYLERILARGNESRGEMSLKYMEGIQISGCCLIFTQRYIQMFDGLNPNIFMYMEEIMLYIRARRFNLRIAYDPELEIVHIEDVATNDLFKNRPKVKRIFKYKCQAESFRVLISELKNG